MNTPWVSGEPDAMWAVKIIVGQEPSLRWSEFDGLRTNTANVERSTGFLTKSTKMAALVYTTGTLSWSRFCWRPMAGTSDGSTEDTVPAAAAGFF